MEMFEIIIALLLLISLLRIAVSSRLEIYIKMLSLQGVFLFFLVFFSLPQGAYLTLVLAIAETLLLKAGFVPFYLHKVMIDNKIKREAEPYVPNTFSLVVMTFNIGLSFWAAYYLKQTIAEISMIFFGTGIAMILNGLFIILSRKKFITQIMGYCVMENGIFLLSLGAAQELPLIVSLGVMLDAFIWVLLAGILVKMLRLEFKQQSIDELKSLRN